MKIETMDLTRKERLLMRHFFPLPQMCPVSGNPQPGSELKIRYTPKDKVLEVYSLKTCIDSFIGGHSNGIRNMEETLQQIASWAAEAVGVTVHVEAELILDAGRMHIEISTP